MSKVWELAKINPKKQKELSDALDVHPIVAQLLVNRGLSDIEEARAFLSSELSTLKDPFLLKDMKKCVERILSARDKNERVLVFGDYDVDGVTSSAILNRVLINLGLEVVHHIPHRMDDGYGLNHDVAEVAKKQGVNLLITIDCGISAYEEVETIKKFGIDVIIIDHHEPSEGKIPKAYAIINPKQKDCPYPFKGLASVGLAAKLVHALKGGMDEDILELVAIGTIADVVPLRDENRIFVKAGLPRIQRTKNLGLKALLDVTKINGKTLKPFHVGFILGPRINAAGRMNTAHDSLDLFLSKSKEEALQLAKELDRYNQERQRTQRDIIDEALAIVEEKGLGEEKVIVLGKEGWHKGVLGIVASRIADKYYRPAVVISLKDGVGTASARSIDGFHLHDALSRCESYLEEFGGHEGAAGLTILQENIDPFRQLINEVADDVFKEEKLTPKIFIDCEIPLGSINMSLANIIDGMEPFGEGNPTPVFCSREVQIKSYPQILGRDTLKFWVSDGVAALSVVGFGMAKHKDVVKPGRRIDLAYEIIIDDWNRPPRPQLKLKDIRES